MDFIKYRTTLRDVMEKEGRIGAYNYMTIHNSYSIDGLPSLALLRKNAPTNIIPIYEDGYVHGKVAAVIDTMDTTNNNNKKANGSVMKQQQQQQLEIFHEIYN
jgi:hypothetical protein